VDGRAATAPVLVVRAELGVESYHRLALVSVELSEVFGAGTAAQDEQHVSSRDLALTDDPGHPPSGRRDDELEI
jgi:hypothetical protein